MTRTRMWLAFAGLVGVGALVELRPDVAHAAAARDERTRPTAVATTPTSPLAFEENRGQTDARVRYVTRSRGITAFLTPTETVLALPSEVVRMKFVGANPSPSVDASGALPGKSHYFIGSDPSKWTIDVPNFEGVVVRDVYPGVDVRWHGDARRRLTYDLVVAPGADVGRIAFVLDGSHGVHLEDDGSLRADTERAELRHSRPVAFQLVDGVRRPVEAAFALTEGGAVRFEIGAHDARRPLVVDPSITYSTYLDGSGSVGAFARVVLDASGAAYVTDMTTSTDFPTQSALQATAGGNGDGFVTKIAPNGTMVYSTYLGGSAADQTRAIAVDATGAAYVTGSTSSTNFPVASAIQGSYAGGQTDAFVAKLAASGSSLVWSTYLGGSMNERGFGIALDGNGAACVAGNTNSTNFPVASPLQGSHGGGVLSDAFVAKINASGSAFVYSTYLGGSGQDDGQAIAVDSTGAAYVAGVTLSSNFPTASPFQASIASNTDAFVAKLGASGSLVYSTYLGGSTGIEAAFCIAVDASGAAYVGGQTQSSDFPVSSAFQSTPGGGGADAFVSKLSASGAALVYSTYLGGGGSGEIAHAVSVDANGRAVFVGGTLSSDFPTVSPVQGAYGGGNTPGDGWVTLFEATGSTLAFSTYLGGSSGDQADGVAFDANGGIYVSGYTGSADFPQVSPLQGYGGGTYDAFLTRITLGPGGPPAPPSPPEVPTNLVATYTDGVGVTLTWDDVSSDETGFRVERHPTGYAFALLANAAANVTTSVDALLYPSTTYTYRVRAFHASGSSAWSNEASVTTPGTAPIPQPPREPTDLSATAGEDFDGTPAVFLAWTDNSVDETLFGVERRVGGRVFEALASVKADVTEALDRDLRPGWPTTYRVRALSLQGPSDYTNDATATIPATVDVAVVSGTLTDSKKARRDKLKVAATYASRGAAALDFVVSGMELQLGPPNAPVTVSIPAASAGWKVKTKKRVPVKATWKSAKGASTKLTVVVDLVKRTLTVTASSFDFSAAPTASQRLLIASGSDGGAHASTWTERRAGVFRFP